jgi:hypothetical protein
VANLTAGGDARPGQVGGEPLLQAVRSAGGEQRRARRPPSHVEQQRRAVRIRSGASEGRGSAARALGIAHRRDQDDLRARGSLGDGNRAGLTLAVLVTANRAATADSGDGGRSRTETAPPSTATSTSSWAQPGRAARAA